MPYQTATIYFMSGTGNSFRAATWLAEAAQEQGILAQVVPIGSGRPAEEIKEGAEHLVGLVMPTHGFTTPWQMLRFALRLPRRRGTHALVLPTRAGTKFGQVFLPGLEGTAGYLPALILALKGYRPQLAGQPGALAGEPEPGGDRDAAPIWVYTGGNLGGLPVVHRGDPGAGHQPVIYLDDADPLLPALPRARDKAQGYGIEGPDLIMDIPGILLAAGRVRPERRIVV